MRGYTFYGTVQDGLLKVDSAAEFSVALRRLNGKAVTVNVATVDRKHARTLPQNSYLWGVVYPLLAEETGYDVEELHEACKFRFLRDRENEKDDLVRIKSTTDLTTTEFSEYVENVRRLAAELGVVIPDPE